MPKAARGHHARNHRALRKSATASKYGAGKVVLTTTPEPESYPGKRTTKDPCPDCGWAVINWHSGNPGDPGDVDPRADCTNPDCGWGY